MLPYLIAGAIGYGIAKLFEEDDKAPKFNDGGSVLLAPNGKPSNLTPEQYKLVRTKAFIQWFGDWENNPEGASKVVDENGEPKVKWRGDNNPKNVFDYINYGGHGVYYFGDVGFAESFGDKLRTYFINCRNPFLPNKTTKKQEKEIRNLLEKDANKILTEIIENNGFNDLYDFLDNYYLIEEGFNENSKPLDILLYQFKNGINYFILEINSIIEWIKNNDYDGYESYEGNYDNIAVFNSNQIKLADGSNTTFDGNNPDIRFNGGGLVPKTTKDENGNWSGSYLGNKFTLYKLSEGWEYSIFYYSPIFESNQIYSSTEDYRPFSTKKDALNTLMEQIIEINLENDNFINQKQSKNPDIRFNGGGEITTYTEFYDNLQIEDGSKYIGQKFSEVFPFLGRRKTPNDFRILLKQYYGIVKRMAEDDYSTKAMKQTDLNKFKSSKSNIDKKKYLAGFYLDSKGIITKFVK